ncbi:transcriptional regulator GcvA [Variovorax sp. Varisp41]|jgi:LysR family glycine cleavage system transcriptional activator|uniref:transcriptional regulator GcvA n=1 Tax=unclassified Variovorax TaxID=663243 RepID=UPI0021BAE99D|nr:transcriptional regulator GcvA [Variovorax sp. CY25R-8]MCT8180505.1 transcriptional regulator GcvA [Variovorax sp. CY25R-8]
MTRRLPPLNALRAFEAAARCGNFTRAAHELCVTQGAVSRHIATLEDWLKVQLFERGRHGIRLTPAGQSYHASMRVAFDQIELGTRQLQQSPDEWLLRIKLPPTFAIRWLIPRLARFHARHPRIDVQITTSHKPTDFERDDVDVSIHSEPSPPEGPGYRLLFRETLLPVCAPALLQRDPPLAQPADLAQHALLSSLNRPQDWPAWLEAAGLSGVDTHRGLKFENAAMAYQAAAEGLGVMMGLLAFVRDDLASGRLVAPLALRLPTEGGYFMAWRADRPVPQRVRDFEHWMAEEVAAAEG